MEHRAVEEQTAVVLCLALTLQPAAAVVVVELLTTRAIPAVPVAVVHSVAQVEQEPQDKVVTVEPEIVSQSQLAAVAAARQQSGLALQLPMQVMVARGKI